MIYDFMIFLWFYDSMIITHRVSHTCGPCRCCRNIRRYICLKIVWLVIQYDRNTYFLTWSIDSFSQEKIGENQPKVLHVQSMFPILKKVNSA